MGGVKARDGDVVRYQFTLYGLGADLGDKPNDQTGGIKALELPNKDSVTKNLALMRQILAKDDKADPEGIYKKRSENRNQYGQHKRTVCSGRAESVRLACRVSAEKSRA